jgi:hypothetical protein
MNRARRHRFLLKQGTRLYQSLIKSVLDGTNGGTGEEV